MAEQGNADTFEYTLAGRTMVFHKTTRTQLIMIQRMMLRIHSQLVDTPQDDDAKLSELMTQMLDMTMEAAESRFTDPLDLMFVEKEILRGNIDENDIMGILANGQRPGGQRDDDADPPPPKRAAKAAGRKTPAKKAANSTTASRRATR